MSVVVAVANNKGGVGKTTTSLNLANILKSKGFKVLLIDLDGQSNATNQCGIEVVDGMPTVYDLLTVHGADIVETIQPTDHYGDLVPADVLLVNAAERMAMLDNREYMLVDAIAPVRDAYDYIVMDCPPTLDIVVKNAFIAADTVIIPMVHDGYGLRGFDKVMAQVEAVRGNPRLNPSLTVSGILVTQFADRTRIGSSFSAQLPKVAEGYGVRVFETPIRKSIKVSEASVVGLPLAMHAPLSKPAHDYGWFVDEFIVETLGASSLDHPSAS